MRPLILLFLLLPALVGCPGDAPRLEHPENWLEAPVAIEGRLAEDAPGRGLMEAGVVGEQDTVYLHREVEFSNEHLRHVETLSGTDQLTLRIWFTPEGAERVAEVARQNIGRRFAVLVNAQVIAAPPIVQPLRPDPEVPVVVTIPLSEQEAAQLADAISRTWPAEEAEPAQP